MVKDTLLFIKALMRFFVAALGLLYRGAKIVQYAFMGWLVYILFRRMTTTALAEVTEDDRLGRISADHARQAAPQYEVEGVYLS